MKHQRHLIPLVQDLHQLLMQVFYFTNVERRRIVVHLREICYIMRIYQKGDNGLLHRSVDYPRSHRSEADIIRQNFFSKA